MSKLRALGPYLNGGHVRLLSVLPVFLLSLRVQGLPSPPQPPRDVVQRPEATGAGVIRGRVVTADTGMPIRRATVNLSYSGPSRPASDSQIAATGSSVAPPPVRPRQSTTDAQGVFEFTNLPAGSYRIFASPGQYSAQYLGSQYGAKRPGDLGRPIELSAGQVVEKVTVALLRGAVIVGRVTDDAGEPIARVQVYGLWFPPGSSRGQRNSSGGQTDDLGQFRLYGLQPGEYVVVAEARNNTFVPPNMTVDREEDSTGLLTTYYPGTADESSAQRVRAAAARETAGVEIRMVAGRLYRVSGTVTDSQGRPAARVNGNIMQRSAGGFPNFGGGFSTDEQGRFQMRNIAPGTYRLMIRPRPPGSEGASTTDPTESANIPLTVSADIENLVIVTTPGITITGQIVFEQGPPSPMPTQMRVFTASAEPGMDFGMNPQPAVVQPDLTFTIKGMMGEYLLRAGVPNVFLKSVVVGGEDVTDTPHEFKPQDRVTIVLTSRASTLEGTVTDTKGTPAPEMAVMVFSEDKAAWRMNSLRTRRASSDSTGHFRIPGLLPGRYYILAAPRERLMVPPSVDLSFFESLIKDATTVLIGEDEQRTVDLKVVASSEGN